MAAAHENLDERLLHRFLFFTDAVFAIVLTLLALELRPPEDAAKGGAAAFAAMGDHLGAFAMSFALIGVFWVVHMSATRRLARFDWPTAVANLIFLFPICLIPFASAWLGRGIGTSFAWTLYGWVLVATSASNIVFLLVMSRGGGRLVTGGYSPRERLFRIVRASSPGLAFALTLVLIGLHQLYWARLCFLLIPVFLVLATVLLKPRPVPAAPKPSPKRRRR